MIDDAQKQMSRDLLIEMRDAFARRDWEATLNVYWRLRDMFAGQRNLRVEATCLAARAMVGQGDRPGARALLKPVGTSEYTKAVHYDFLAHAFLDLKNYKEVARVCERADALIEVEKQG